MKVFAVLAVFATLATQSFAAINTPASAVQCEPLQITWDASTPPYFLTILPGGQPSASPLKSFPQQTGTEFTWTVDIAQGTTLTLALRDSTGQQFFSDIVTVQPSSNATCVNTTVDEGGPASGATGATTPATSGASTPAASTPAASTTSTTTTTSKSTSTTSTSSKPASSGSSSSSSASPSSTSNAAVRGSSMNAFGVAGLLGLVGAALL